MTPADALLVWLRVYSFSDLKNQTESELIKNLSAIWPDVKVLARPRRLQSVRPRKRSRTRDF